MAKIETGIPIPDRRKGRPKESKWPFSDMAVGDSFASLKKSPTEASFRSLASKMGKELGKEFTVATVVENNHPIIRVWRTK